MGWPQILTAWATAAALVFVFEVMWSFFWLRHGDGWEFAYHRLPAELFFTLTAASIWLIWLNKHPKSAIPVRNAFSWVTITNWIQRHKAVKVAPFAIAIIAYFGNVLATALSSSSEWVRNTAEFINEHILTFKIYGQILRANDVLFLELVGFFFAVMAYGLYCLMAPEVLRSKVAEFKAALAETIVKRHSYVEARELALTVKDLCKRLSKKKRTDFDWTAIKTEVVSLDERLAASPTAAVQTCVEIVRIGPVDEVEYRETAKALFGVTRPGVRHLIAGFLLLAFVLTTLPVLLRLFFFVRPN